MTSSVVNPVTVLPTVGTPAKHLYTGTYAAVVVNVNDPLSLNRIQMHVPQVLGTAISNWATPIGMLPSSLGGIVPAVGSLIHAMFNGGDINKPVWLSKVQSVTPPAPTSWTALTLSGGWSNVSGKAAAQYRPSGSDGVEIIGNIQSGTTTDGTTVAVLPSGSRPASGHSFNIDCVTGAASVSVSGSLTDGTVSEGFLNDPTINLNTILSSPIDPAGTYSGSTLSDLTSYVVAFGHDFNAGNELSDGGGALFDTSVGSQSLNNTATTTTVNYDSPTMTVDTSGNLKITGVNSHVTAISFHHTISLTA